MHDQHTYYALRVCPAADAPLWWATASAHAATAPAGIRAIVLGSRRRVELDAGDAAASLAWARALDGWPDDGPTPVWIYPAAPQEAALDSA